MSIAFTATVEGVDEMLASVDRHATDLRRELAADSYDAAKEGVEAEQARHPYTDRTRVLSFTAHPEHGPDGDAFMFWPAEYASYVDGRAPGSDTSSGKFAFTPMAEYAAESTLNRKVAEDVDDFCRAVEGEG